ncbi:hypothetical protein GCM10020258_01490 [Sphingomonas yabuuchiae]
MSPLPPLPKPLRTIAGAGVRVGIAGRVGIIAVRVGTVVPAGIAAVPAGIVVPAGAVRAVPVTPMAMTVRA